MIDPATSAFLFIAFYLVCVMASRVSVRPFYKRMWSVAASILGFAICVVAFTYVLGLAAVLLAI